MALFKPFRSISNYGAEKKKKKSSNESFAFAPKKADLEWVATEKIHGANFVFLSDGVHVWCANRTRVLHPGAVFMDHHIVAERYADQFKRLYTIVAADMPGVTQIAVFGEIFGGGYPHPDVKPTAFVKRVQPGIWYTPDIEFAAFELQIIRKQADSGSEASADATGSTEEKEAAHAAGAGHDPWSIQDDEDASPEDDTVDELGSVQGNCLYTFLDFDVACGYFERSGIFHLKALARGRLHDIIFDVELMVTTIPDLFGLPTIPGNLAEGVVYKTTTVTEKGFHSMLKHKRKAMSEVEKAAKRTSKAPRTEEAAEGQRKILASHQPAWTAVEEALCYLTRNRTLNVLSKIGNHFAVSSKIGYVSTLLLIDSWKDFQREQPAAATAIRALTEALRRTAEGVLEERAKTVVMDLIRELTSEVYYHV